MKQRNQTISAEGMDILHRYRCRNHAGADDVFTKDTDALIKVIEALEAAEAPHRPTLHPAIARYVNGASVDLLWLRDRHGIVFADVDYAAPRRRRGRRRRGASPRSAPWTQAGATACSPRPSIRTASPPRRARRTTTPGGTGRSRPSTTT